MRSPESPRKVPGWVPVLVGILALSSCSFPGARTAVNTKVDVDTLSTDILFGVPPKAVATAAPEQAVVIPPPPLTIDQPPSFSFGGNSFVFPTFPAAAACPQASATSFPATVATSGVTTMPTEGHVRWAASGTYDMLVLTTTAKLPLPSFEDRYVRHARTFTDTTPALPGSTPDYAFTYETIEPHVGGTGSLLYYWQVKANAASASANGTTAGDPEGGLALTRIDTLDQAGKNTGTIFMGKPGLLFLPTPVQPGATINSTSIDTSGSAAGGSMTLKGTVGNRERVDACGDLIQAWGVDATLTPAGAGAGTPATIHYDVATQMGALMVAFNITGDGSYLGTTFHDARARLGQLQPDALPDKYK